MVLNSTAPATRSKVNPIPNLTALGLQTECKLKGVEETQNRSLRSSRKMGLLLFCFKDYVFLCNQSWH